MILAVAGLTLVGLRLGAHVRSFTVGLSLGVVFVSFPVGFGVLPHGVSFWVGVLWVAVLVLVADGGWC